MADSPSLSFRTAPYKPARVLLVQYRHHGHEHVCTRKDFTEASRNAAEGNGNPGTQPCAGSVKWL